jgi:tetratricopeptide (TPR) repeat protein
MNKNLIVPGIVLTALVIFGYYYFQFMAHESVPGENMFRMANQYLQDGKHDDALKTFDKVIADFPDYKDAYMGRAITLMQMQEFKRSRMDFDRALALDKDFAAAYANRGILNDRTGKYEEAVSDYRKAIELNPEVAEGPGLIWRFLHNVSEKPSTLADRADYIEKELKKPEAERLLRVPEIDEQQRMYKK